MIDLNKLAEQAGFCHDINNGIYLCAPMHMEKFAELIVKECMACSTWVGKMNNNTIEPLHTAHAINQHIKKHFGVKE